MGRCYIESNEIRQTEVARRRVRSDRPCPSRTARGTVVRLSGPGPAAGAEQPERVTADCTLTGAPGSVFRG